MKIPFIAAFALVFAMAGCTAETAPAPEETNVQGINDMDEATPAGDVSTTAARIKCTDHSDGTTTCCTKTACTTF